MSCTNSVLGVCKFMADVCIRKTNKLVTRKGAASFIAYDHLTLF